MKATSPHDLTTRYNEVKSLVADNDLEAATLRLMDLSKDFARERNLINSTVAIRSQYSHLRDEQRKLGHTDDVALQRVRYAILEFADLIYEHTSTPTHSTTENVSITPTSATSAATTEQLPSVTEPSSYEDERARFAAQWRSKTTPSDPVLVKAQAVSRGFRRGEIQFQLEPITFEIHAGEITAIVGTNGSGKTTLLRLIAGEVRPHAGQILYPGLRGTEGSLYEVKSNIAYLPQSLDPWRGSLLDYLHFTAAIHGIHGVDNEIETEWVLYRLGLEQYKDARWAQLSGGYRTRFALANALLTRARLLVLDEPLANLDVNAQSRFLRDLRDRADSPELPLGIVISSQHIHQVEQIADRIIVLRDGKIAYQGMVRLFGADRDDNLFEVECTASIAQLRQLLEPFDYRQIVSEGQLFTIYTGRHISSSQVIQLLIQANVTITSFRDISTSTRRIFLTDRDTP